MSIIGDKQAAAAVVQDQRAKERDRLAQQFAAVFSTDDGREVLALLAKRFDLLGRTFQATDRGDVNALRAAVRDGERAAIHFIFQSIRAAKPDYPFPL
jgi:ketosteroid isomerase-like protein